MKIPLQIAALLLVASSAAAGECKSLVDPALESERVANVRELFGVCSAEAAAGDAEALYYLSHFYFGFAGFEMDVAKAVSVARTAAEKGYGPAQHWMGWQHETGSHLERDEVNALAWYRRAAESGYWMAFDRLALAYRDGDLGLPVDEEKSRHFLELKRQCK
jgi:TPR repeat protein